MQKFTSESAKQLRMDLRMNQREFARVIGMSSTMVAAIENGRRPITETTNVKLDKVVQYVDLMIGEEWSTYLRCNAEIDRLMLDGLPALSF